MSNLIEGKSESARIYHYMRDLSTPMANKQIAHDLDITVHNVSSNMSQLRELGYASYTREGRKTFWVCHKERLLEPQRAIHVRKSKVVKPCSSKEIISQINKLMVELSEAIACEMKTTEEVTFNDFLEFRQSKV